jgi:hypothetical protein
MKIQRFFIGTNFFKDNFAITKNHRFDFIALTPTYGAYQVAPFFLG